MFNRCTYGIIFKILNRLILKLLHSQIWVSTPLLCLSVPQGNNSTPSAFYNWGVKIYWVSSIFLGVHAKFKMIIYSNLQIINLLKKGKYVTSTVTLWVPVFVKVYFLFSFVKCHDWKGMTFSHNLNKWQTMFHLPNSSNVRLGNRTQTCNSSNCYVIKLWIYFHFTCCLNNFLLNITAFIWPTLFN